MEVVGRQEEQCTLIRRGGPRHFLPQSREKEGKEAHGVTVAQQTLVLLVLVRIQVGLLVEIGNRDTANGTTMTNSNGQSKAPIAIILAAGKGTRMGSDLPKVVHEVGGRPMVCAVVDACREAGCERIVLVVGYKQEVVRELMAAQGTQWNRGIEYAVQEQQLGTGHAVLSAKGTLGAAAAELGRPCFVLAGDGPLIRAETLKTLLGTHITAHAAATLATSVIDDPTGYGRIARNPDRSLRAIVEHKDCTPEQLKIREVNPSYYCFDTARLFSALADVKRNEGSGEYYITDVPELMLKRGERVEVIEAVPPQDILSINTPAQLAEVDSIYRSRSTSTSLPGAAR